MVTFTYNGSATVPTGAGSYTVVGTINDANYQGSASGTLVIAEASASVTLGQPEPTYSGSVEPATATTIPGGLTVNFTYNWFGDGADERRELHGGWDDQRPQLPRQCDRHAGHGEATGSVTLGSLSETYDGSAKAATATTTPGGLAVNFTYNGSATVPTSAGSYTVVGTINDANYQGSAMVRWSSLKHQHPSRWAA